MEIERNFAIKCFTASKSSLGSKAELLKMEIERFIYYRYCIECCYYEAKLNS